MQATIPILRVYCTYRWMQCLYYVFIVLFSLYYKYVSLIIPSCAGLANTIVVLPSQYGWFPAYSNNHQKWTIKYTGNGMIWRCGCHLLLLHLDQWEVCRHQWLRWNPSPLYCISLSKAAQWHMHFRDNLLSIPLPSTSPSWVCVEDFPIRCSPRWNVDVSRLLFCLCPHTCSTNCCFSVQITPGVCPRVCVQTSVGRIYQSVASHYSLGWVSSSQLCLSTSSHEVDCICWPPSQPLPPTLQLSIAWCCLPMWCILDHVLCMICWPLMHDVVGDLLPHSRGYQCVPRPSGLEL